MPESTVAPAPAEPPAPDTSLKNVKALGIVSLLTDASSEAIYPILPLFLSSVLGTPVAVIGVIESIAEATASLMKVFSGWLSDRVGRRRPLILVGYALSNLMKPVLAIAGNWPAVLAVRFADRFGKGIRTAPRDALIADSAPPEVRGKAFGLHRALDTLGAAIGPLVAWATLSLVHGAAGFRTVFLISAIPGIAAIVVLVFAVRERRPHAPADTRPPLGFKHLGVPFGVFTAISAVFALGNSSDAMLILRAKDLGTATAVVPLMYFVFNLVGAAVATPAGILSDRVGRRRMLTVGFAAYGVVYAGFAFASPAHGWVPWLLFAAYGVPYAMTEGMARAFVVDLVGPDCRGTAVGSYTFVLGLAALPSSAVAGILWDTVGHSAPFFLSAGLMLVSAVALGVAGRMLKPLEIHTAF
ncbi:MAG: MFS transporter [Actinomycetia bacterium]|nr:MFS transporter [Actinomycetes bacterium]